MRLLSPAKINLSLKITGRDPADGYHFLDSVFDPVSLYDIIDVEKTPGNKVQVIDFFKSLKIPPEKNIMFKAASLMKKNYKIKGGIKITFYKYIPSGAGLGGGSSNAASVIKGVNCLYKLGLKDTEMASIGFKLGSDVPFFIYLKRAHVTGKGNKIKAILRIKKNWYVICVPRGIRVSTKEAYKWYDDEKKLTKAVSYTKLNVTKRKAGTVKSNNDFESPVFRKYGKLKKLKEDFLRHGSVSASLSGSGSAVFGIFSDRRGAVSCYKKIRSAWRGSFVSLAHTV
jgi:4-diphosphocytidyl-2-C-methyl-D-erythritol kinase